MKFMTSMSIENLQILYQQLIILLLVTLQRYLMEILLILLVIDQN
jgi:hypothetical protein